MVNWRVPELADREAGPADGERRDDRVDAAAVGQAGIHERLAFVDAAADLGDDPLDDRLGDFGRDEPPAGKLDEAFALEIDLVVRRRP